MSTVATAPELVRRLEDGARALGLALSAAQLAAILDFCGMLQKWNGVYNLTAIRDPAAIVSHHLLDSLALARHIPRGSVLDVGSGAGFPGIPLAIANPLLEVTLLDSNQKKAAFQRHTLAELRLPNARVACARVEDWRPGRGFDWIVSRAFAALGDFVASARHLLAPGGVFVAMKGLYPEDEIRRLDAGFRVRESIEVEVPGLQAERHIVIVEPA